MLNYFFVSWQSTERIPHQEIFFVLFNMATNTLCSEFMFPYYLDCIVSFNKLTNNHAMCSVRPYIDTLLS